jgi:hypothetical protein
VITRPGFDSEENCIFDGKNKFFLPSLMLNQQR